MMSWQRLIVCLSLSFILALPLHLDLRANALALPQAPLADSAEAQPGRLVLGVPPGADAAAVQALAAQAGAAVERWLPELGLAVLAVPPGAEAGALAALDGAPGVDFVTAHRPSVSAADTPLDEFWAQQWGPAQVAGPAAWDLAWGDPSVPIAIVDSGVFQEHLDLWEQTWRNPGESAVDPLTGERTCDAPIAHNGMDDDDNGYFDDCLGYDFVMGDRDPTDDYGHGTFVAGIAAAATNNWAAASGVHQGIAGMARGARLMAVRALNSYGAGYPADVAEAITYAANNGAGVINLSLTLPVVNPNPNDVEIIGRAVAAAQARGVLIVAAAGNQGYNGVAYPAKFAGVLAVGASTPADGRASFSNYGSRLDLLAPGTGIFSTLFADADAYGLYGGAGNGTSFAAPHAAGVAALVRALRPDLPAADVRELLLAAADDIGAPGPDGQTGRGRLNAARAVYSATLGLNIALAAAPASVPVGGESLLVVQVTTPASPQYFGAAGARVTFAAEGGVVTPTVATTDAAGRVSVYFTAGAVTRTAAITATLGAASAALPLMVTSGQPAALALTVAPARIRSGGGQAVITATLQDEGGSAVLDGVTVTFSTTLGVLTPLEATTQAGRAVTVLTSDALSGAALIIAAAEAVAGGVMVEVIGAGQAYTVALTAAPAALEVGGAPATVTAAVFDALGDPLIDGTRVQFAAAGGVISPTEAALAGGQALAQFWPGTATGLAEVLATVGSAVGVLVVPLAAGPIHALTLTVGPAELVAGYGQVAQLQVAAADRFGNPAADGTALAFTSTLGAVSPAAVTTIRGAAQASFVGGTAAGSATITVTAGSGASAAMTVRIRPAPLVSLALVVAPTSVPVGGSPARLRATLRDPYGNLAEDGTAVTFTTDLGALALPPGADVTLSGSDSLPLASPAPSEASRGVGRDASAQTTGLSMTSAVAALTVPTVGGVAQADLLSTTTAGTANVTAAASAQLRGAAQVVFTPGAPHLLLLVIEPPKIPAGGVAQVVATVRDRYGNVVTDGTVVRFAADWGQVDPAEAQTAHGVALAQLTVSNRVGPITIAALSGSVSAFASAEVVPTRQYLPLLVR